MMKNVAVYCASSTQLDEKYYRAARELGAELGKRGLTVVNGAGNMGLMQVSADACMEAGGEAIGVIPTFMIEQNWHHRGMTQLIETATMEERKATIERLSDAAVILPGGIGTFDEFFQIATLKQLGLYPHPIVILNVDGYFDPMLEMLQRAMDENFMRDIHAGIWRVATTATEAVELLLSTPLWDSSIRRFAKI